MTSVIDSVEILEQPHHWPRVITGGQAVAEQLPIWAQGQKFQATGEGSSLYALRLALWQWQQWVPRWQSEVLPPWQQALQPVWPDSEKTFQLIVSQSGRTGSILSLADQQEWTNETPGLLVTNNADAPKLLRHNVCLEVGPEKAIAATKTFTGSLLLLWSLGLAQAERADLIRSSKADAFRKTVSSELKRLGEWLTESLASNYWMTALRQQWPDEPPDKLLLVSHDIEALALPECQLKWMEVTQRATLAYHSETVQHGPKAVLADTSTQWGVLVWPPAKEGSILQTDIEKLQLPVNSIFTVGTALNTEEAIAIPEVEPLPILLWFRMILSTQCLALAWHQRWGQQTKSNLAKFVG